jgi:hypothetical protein
MLEGAAGDALSLLYEIEKADPSQRRYLAAGDRYIDARRALRAALRAAASCEAAKGKGAAA